MPVILGFLGSIVTILVLLRQLAEAGIDLGGLNPFLWKRRRAWQKKLEGNPVFQIESPLEMTALLMTATAKSDGDMSGEEKKAILSMFQTEFNLSKREAADLFISSAFLFGDGVEINANLDKVLTPSMAQFSVDQIKSALKLIGDVAELDSGDSEMKTGFVSKVQPILEKKLEPEPKWQ